MSSNSFWAYTPWMPWQHLNSPGWLGRCDKYLFLPFSLSLSVTCQVTLMHSVKLATHWPTERLIADLTINVYALLLIITPDFLEGQHPF